MESWKQLAQVTIEVPIRSAGNVVINEPIMFEVYQDGLFYKAIPQCSEEQKRMGLLKEELIFSFRPDKAVSLSGINDGNQHIAERIGESLKEQGF